MSVGELQRRLAAQGVRISRGALYRIVSDQPIESVSLPVIMPVLEQLGLTFEDAFRPTREGEIVEQEQVRKRAREILASLPKANRADGFSPEVERELREVIERTGEELRARKPELFDSRGRLRRRAAAREIAQRLHGRTLATEEIYAGLTSPPTGQADRSSEAPPNGG
jgi:hypothetical protein